MDQHPDSLARAQGPQPAACRSWQPGTAGLLRALDKPLPSRSYNLHRREPTFQSRVVTQGGRCTPKLNEPSKLLQQPIQRSKVSQFDPKGQWAHRAWLSAEVAHTNEVYLSRFPQPDGSHMQYSIRSCRDSQGPLQVRHMHGREGK